MKRFVVWAILALAFLGIADSSYLLQHESSGTPLICDIQGLDGCNIVAESAYSTLFGLPVAAYGVAFYSLLFVLAALALALDVWYVRRAIQWITALGAVVSLYFLYVQIALIGAFCVYCLASEVFTFISAALAFSIEPWRNDAHA